MTDKRNSQWQSIMLKELPVPSGWMIAPTSFLVDRIIPRPEYVFLQTTATGGGEFRVRTGEFTFELPRGPKYKALATFRRETRLQDGDPVIDLRSGSPENWAHFLNIHLAVLACISRMLDRPYTAFRILLPQKTPGYIKALIDLTSLRCLYSDDVVHAFGVQFDFESWDCVRGERCHLLNDPQLSPVAAAIRSGVIGQMDTPKKLFVSRRNTRHLINEDEIENLLSSKGFTKVYMEDLDVSAQIRFALNAEEIIAVHGAALAPIIYRNGDARPLRLIEIFPVGHITNVYRAIMSGIGGSWMGVRGYIEKPNLAEIYHLDQPYTKHSLQNFRVDPQSIERAFEGAPT